MKEKMDNFSSKSYFSSMQKKEKSEINCMRSDDNMQKHSFSISALKDDLSFYMSINLF